MEQIDTGWVYSDFTVMAKNAGGPIEFIEQTKSAGYEDGYSDGLGIGILAGVGVTAIVVAVLKVRDHFNKMSAERAALLEKEQVLAKAAESRVQNEDVDVSVVGESADAQERAGVDKIEVNPA